MMPVADAAEGDVNLGDRRQAWQRDNLDPDTRALLAEDARWFRRTETGIVLITQDMLNARAKVLG